MAVSIVTPLIPVILAGGAGTRLWPVSRGTRPKHLARLIGDESLLQQAARRAVARVAPEHVVTVGAQAQDFLIRHQLTAVAPGLGAHRLLEPIGRNTAAAIALAALYTMQRFSPAAAIWVCPSDHLVANPAALYGALDAALPAAAAGHLVTFGITPTRPETGYGYIRIGMAIAASPQVLAVRRFVEKPQRAAAEAMIAEGGYLWNSGMFLFRADRILAELGAHAPQILEGVEHAFAALRAMPGGGFEVPEDRYAAVPAAPIDKAVMEHARADRRRALRPRLVRSRLVAGALGAAAQRRRGQRHPGRRSAGRERELSGPCRAPPRRLRRRPRSRGDRDR